jgi:23S rRNA pseudoU1915 N3-methylase RlmH
MKKELKIEDFTRSIKKAIDKMLIQKAKDNLDVVIAGPDGIPKHIKASELIK